MGCCRTFPERTLGFTFQWQTTPDLKETFSQTHLLHAAFWLSNTEIYQMRWGLFFSLQSFILSSSCFAAHKVSAYLIYNAASHLSINTSSSSKTSSAPGLILALSSLGSLPPPPLWSERRRDLFGSLSIFSGGFCGLQVMLAPFCKH